MKHISSDTELREYVESLGHKDAILIPDQANACIGVAIDPATHSARLIYSCASILDNYHYEDGLSYAEASKRFANDIFAPLAKHHNRAPLICYELIDPHHSLATERELGKATRKFIKASKGRKPTHT